MADVRVSEQALWDELDGRDMADRCSWVTRLILLVFGRRLNRDVFFAVLGRALERGIIHNHQFYILHRQFDPTQKGLVGLIAKRK